MDLLKQKYKYLFSNKIVYLLLIVILSLSFTALAANSRMLSIDNEIDFPRDI